MMERAVPNHFGRELLGVMGRGSAGARLRGMGRGNDAKTALGVIKETK